MLAAHALRDPLTDIHNRRYLLDIWARLQSQARREQQPTYFMLFDLDHFKQLNDLHGHQAGDEALRQFARLLAAFARRPLDVAARIGGEEFALVLHGCDSANGRLIADRIRAALRALEIPSRSGACLSVSIGAVELGSVLLFEQAYSLADACLYEAKRQGRDGLVEHGAGAGLIRAG